MKCIVLCRGVGNVLVGRHGMFLWETGIVLPMGRKCPGGEQEMF
jgi:hypothetical protein